MKILVVSDTHNDYKNFKLAIKIEQPFDMLIHLGDNESDVYALEDLLKDIPIKNVVGNCDWYGESEELFFKVKNNNIFICHGHRYSVKSSLTLLMEKAKSINANIVLFGHTHKPLIEKEDGIYFFNPGSLGHPRGMSRPSYGIINIQEDKEPTFKIEYL